MSEQRTLGSYKQLESMRKEGWGIFRIKNLCGRESNISIFCRMKSILIILKEFCLKYTEPCVERQF